MLSSTALGTPRFSITRDRRSSSTRRRSFPKFARARSAETTMVPFLLRGVVATNSPFQLLELYSSRAAQSTLFSMYRAGGFAHFESVESVASLVDDAPG